MPYPSVAIAPEQRTAAALTHLSGLAGYLVPFCGVIVPLVIWMVKSDSPVIVSIAKQAVLLNVVAFLLAGAGFLLFLTILLIPVAILLWCVLGIAAVVLPIIGAVKASEGAYFKYPLIGIAP
jgi:uncharacterized Tic20 family protein